MEVTLLDWNVEYYEQNANACEKLLNELDDWSAVDTINIVPLHNLKDGYLARYQGMVQDGLNPEYYSTTYTIKNKTTGDIKRKDGKYIDLLHCKDSEEVEDDEGNCKDVRQPLFCVPFPGLNDWTKTPCLEKQIVGSSRCFGQKRPLPADESGMEVDVSVDNRPRPTPPNPGNPNAPSSSYGVDKYFPFPEENGLACIVKYYGDRDDYLVNTRIEVIGFLSLSPSLEATWEDSDAEDKAIHPPPSLVPRLHALRIRKLFHCNPLLGLKLSITEGEAKYIRSDLHTVLTQIVFGDTLAADYILFNLIASIYARQDGLCLGALSLNLHNIRLPGYAKELYRFLQTLVPCSVYVPLTVDDLNTSSFIPKKDYQTNRLCSGRLQLADGTLLFLDETTLGVGQMTQQGLQNLNSLQSVSVHQEVRYDFTYYNLDFHTNLPVMVMSEGKSMITTNVCFPVKPESGTESTTSETFEAARFFLSGQRLEAARKYLSAVRLSTCDMSNLDFVGQAWVELRQQNHELKEDDLHRLLVLSRVICLGDGRSSISQSDWERAVTLESERRTRR